MQALFEWRQNYEGITPYIRDIKVYWNNLANLTIRFRSHWALAMQKWQIFAKDFGKEWVDYPLLAMTTNTIAIAHAQCEPTLMVVIGKSVNIVGLVNRF